MELFHQSCGRIAEMKRDGLVSRLPDVFGGFGIGRVDRIRFWGGGEINHTLSQSQFAFRKADEVKRVFGVQSDTKRVRVRNADVFGSKSHEAPRHVEWIFSRFEHPRQPI